jgi:tetratricopeptide (TPR) repeat protein
LNEARHPCLENAAPKAFFRHVFSHLLKGRDDRTDPERRDDLVLARYLKARGKPLSRWEYMDMLSDLMNSLPQPVAKSWLDDWLARFPNDPRAWFRVYMYEKEEGNRPAAVAALKRSARLDPSNKRLQELLAEARKGDVPGKASP